MKIMVLSFVIPWLLVNVGVVVLLLRRNEHR